MAEAPAARPAPPADWDVPEGFRLAAVPDEGWRLASGEPRRCSRLVCNVRCGRDAVAELMRMRRGRRTRPAWWGYCPEHMYGRWVEDGKVMHWILVEDSRG
jgi:hypothetical protein